MKILLTNDDSHKSPLLAFIIENLKKRADLTVVVPKHEQSWKGKSMTRFGYLHMEEIDLYGHPSYTIDGTPADCVNIALYNLFSKSNKPDMVISGINAGLNAGLGFIWSSGTLGACFEANIAGIPGIAFSQHFDSDTRDAYIDSYAISEVTYDKLKKQSEIILNKTLDLFLNEKTDLLKEPITWNINLPFNTNPHMQYVPCSSGQSFYGSCYKKSDLGSDSGLMQNLIRFEHELTDVSIDQSKTSDSSLLFDGHVTITPIDLRTFAQLSEAEYQKLTKIMK